MKLSTVQSKIAKQGLAWEAGKTSKSALTKNELMQGSGGVISDPEIARLSKDMFAASNALQERIDSTAGTTPPPECFSWLDDNDVVTPAKDQNPGNVPCNSCVSFAVVSAIEARMNIQTRQKSGEVNLSEGYLFFKGCGFCCKNGWFIPSALDFCINSGLPSEESFPYSPGTATLPAAISPVVKLMRRSKVANQLEIQRTIATKGPVVAEMDLHEDFKHYRTGIYSPTATTSATTHAVCIVGYCNTPVPHWICKNSWGTQWGCDPRDDAAPSQGFFKIAFGACGIASRYLVYDFDVQVLLSLAEATIAMTAIRDKALASQSFRLCLTSTLVPDASGPMCSSVAEMDVSILAADILAVYPKLFSILEPVFQ